MTKILKNRYLVFTLLAGLFLISKFLSIVHESDTSGIFVSAEFLEIYCDKNIEIIKSRNISNLFDHDLLQHKGNLKTAICTADKVFDGSNQDRRSLYNFTVKNLEFWTVNRRDIATYFYKKITSANPDDDLSKMIEEQKL